MYACKYVYMILFEMGLCFKKHIFNWKHYKWFMYFIYEAYQSS